MAWSALVLLPLSFTVPPSRPLCYAAWGSDADTSRAAAVQAFLAEADAVVLVRATDTLRATVDTMDLLRGRRVRFAVEEVLRGEDIGSELIRPGFAVNEDDYNTDTIPYIWARADAQTGGCFAFSYRLGAEYLLILKRAAPNSVLFGAGTLTPYWAPLRPTNEQLRGPHDPWLAWVRRTLVSQHRSRRGV